MEKRREMKRGSNGETERERRRGERVEGANSGANKASLLFITMAAYSDL